MADEMNTDARPGAKAPRWMRGLLVVSLALNLLVVGLVAGSVLGKSRSGGRSVEAHEFQRHPLIGALARDDRREVMQQLRRDNGQHRENAKALRTRFRAYLEALRADAFDADAIEQLLKDQREAMGGWQDGVDGILLQTLSDMTPEERLAYADRLEELGRRGRKRR